YRKIIQLLLEQWDRERNVKRKSRYAGFTPEEKEEFLSHLAYDLTISTGRSIFEEGALRESYDRIYNNFPLDAAEREEVIAEVESHTGLFLESGFERYEFMHKSIQEFLTAEYIVRLGSIPDLTSIDGLGAEMAIAVAISSNAGEYVTRLSKEVDMKDNV